MKKISLVFLLIAMIGFSASAQVNSFERYSNSRTWTLGLTLGGTALHGDVGILGDNFGFNGGLSLKKSFGTAFGLRARGYYGILNGMRGDLASQPTTVNPDPVSGGVGYEVKTTGFAWDVSTVWTIGNLSYFKPLRKSEWYFTVGIGQIIYSATGNFADSVSVGGGEKIMDVQFDDNAIVVPMGIGWKYNVSNMVDLGLEYTFHYTRDDVLDGFSFPAFANRGTDYYSMLNLTVGVKLGKKGQPHRDWMNPTGDVFERLDSIQNRVIAISKDSDGDGVADHFDQEPETEEGLMVWGNGMAVDSDGDGIVDGNDDEPFSENGSEVDENGVMIDKDGDGVPDYRDEDPNTPEGTLVTSKGIKGKGGGSVDCDDVTLPSVIFDNGSSRVKPEYYGTLYNVAERMKQCPDLKVKVMGYSASGKSTQQLAWKRANAIVDYINTTYGVSKSRFVIDEKGSGKPSGDYGSRQIDLIKAGENETGTETPPHPGM